MNVHELCIKQKKELILNSLHNFFFPQANSETVILVI